MESYPIYDHEVKPNHDIVDEIKDIFDNSQFMLQINHTDIDFQKEIQHIQTTLSTRKWGFYRCDNDATKFIDNKEQWITLCDKHSDSQRSTKLIHILFLIINDRVK